MDSWNTGGGSVVWLQSEGVSGYFPAGGLFHGSTVYVTTHRIIVNKGRGQAGLDPRVHIPLAILIGLAPFAPPDIAVLILLGVVTGSVAYYLTRRRHRPKWPTTERVEKRHRRFEVSTNGLLGIELKLGRLQRAQMTISSLSGEQQTLKILGKRNIRVATQLLGVFAAGRFKVVD